MFDLEKAIKAWKKELARNPALEDTYISELESVLRDEVADLVSQGESEEEAFRRACAGMGEASEIGAEFSKVRPPQRRLGPNGLRPPFLSALLWSYIRIALRKIRRQKGFSFITIAGLAVGLACSILMMLWIHDEKSFDRFHANRDSIYRLIKVTRTSEKTTFDARTPYPLGEAILEKVPEVVNFVRYQGVFGRWEMTHGDKTFYNDNIGTADPSFFEIFTFPFIQGDPKTALIDRSSIVLSESMARKYFGAEDPMGKVMTMHQGREAFKVTGVMGDVPKNSHLMFDCVIPSVNFWEWWDGAELGWNMIMFYTYIQLAPNTSVAAVGQKIAGVLHENVPTSRAEFIVQPLMDVHLKSNFEWDLDNYAQGSQSTLDIFTLVALGILLLAMINFMNLSTARSANRAKEVGLRKVTGAFRVDIIKQFLGESVVLSFISFLLALLLVWQVLPLFNSLAGKQLSLIRVVQAGMLPALLGITLLTGLLSGIYPALFLSSFQPAKVLKGGWFSGRRGQPILRKSLVVFQFTLTLMLVIGTAVVDRQLKFVGEKDLGIDTHNVVTFNGFFDQFPSARNILLANPSVLNVTCSDSPQFDQRGISDVTWEGKNPEDEILFFPVRVDADYLQTFRIGLAEGRFFSRDFPSDVTESLVINEAAVRAMGLTSPIGKRVTVGGEAYAVIGVVRDFHQSSLHRPIEPMILRTSRLPIPPTCVRINPVNTTETIAFIEETMKTFMPNVRFNYEFLDDRIEGFYSSERKVETILSLFTGIALFTACLGLFGLASFLAEKRTKEIGIRKVLGAKVGGLVWLQAWEFSKWILLSGLVAAPVAYYEAVQWLRGFTYHIRPGVDIFLIAGLLTWLAAMFAVGFQSVRAAIANPVDSLRYE
jgi:putative ABC transport system permease protein